MIDLNQSLSEYVETALWAAIKNDAKPDSRRRAKEQRKIYELERIVKSLGR